MSEGSPPESKFAQFQQSLNEFLHDQQNPFAQVFALAEKYSQNRVKRTHAFWGVCVFIGLYLLFGYGAALLANLVGFVYPAYKSCKAIESTDKDDDTLWLTYWVVFAFFGVIEYFTDILLWWIPFYFFLKCLFLVWCFVPSETFNGSIIIYQNIIRKLVSKYEKKIDQGIKEASSIARDAARQGMSVVREHASNPSNIQMAMNAASSISDTLNEESKKDS